MQLIRVLLAVAIVLCLSAFTAGDPLTNCAPVSVDTFSVQTIAGTDSELALLSVVNGTYPIQFYTTTLSSHLAGTSVFFTIVLTPNSTINTTGTIGVTFTISLNGVFKNTSNGAPQVFSPSPTTGQSIVEFFNWLSAPVAINNTLMLNVSETITVGQDVTSCSYIYTIVITNPGNPPSTGGFVVGDPQFVGLRGQKFQIHGVDGAVYNIISDKSMQLNARFTFLEGPRPCPVIPSTGQISTACWTHPGSYLSELALQTIGGSQLLIVSGTAKTGFASITLNGKELTVGASGKLDFANSGLSGSVTLENTHELTLKAGHFIIVVENNDGFVNLNQVSVPSTSWSKLQSHGLLGQTWHNKRYSGKVREIEGEVDDYLIEDDNLFGINFPFNRFTHPVQEL